jgi:hypothetical protein
VLEMLQLVIPDRHGHMADALVKAAGGAFGVAAAALIALVVAERRKGPVKR